MGMPQNGWFIMENPIQMIYPHDKTETSIWEYGETP